MKTFSRVKILSLSLFCLLAFDNWTSADRPRTWVVLISVQDHKQPEFNNLRFTQLDALELRRVFTERSNIAGEVLEFIDAAPAGRTPTSSNIKVGLEKFLNNKEIKPNDRIIIYFSGHGFLHNEETLLATSDFDLDSPLDTSISARFIRAILGRCIAGTKLLILDCCHAAATDDLSNNIPDGEQVADSFDVNSVGGCIVIASSMKREISHEWPERNHGLFTYWLIRGLEGGADFDSNGLLDIDEIYRYVNDRVTGTVRANPKIFGRQSPVRIIGNDVSGVPTIIELRPEPPETVCRRIAEHLDIEIRSSGFNRIGLIEFVSPKGGKEGLISANLPSFCAERIRVALSALASRKYSVLSNESVAKTLNEKGIRVRHIGDPDKMRQAADDSSIDCFVWGILRRRGRHFDLSCELMASDGTVVGKVSGVVPINEDLIGDMGVSFDNRARPNKTSYSIEVVDHVFDRATTHPVLQNNFPFEIEIYSVRLDSNSRVVSREKKEFFLIPGSDERFPEIAVKAKPGELFDIQVGNKYHDDVAMTCLMDGFNALGQRQERLGRARSFVLRRKPDLNLIKQLTEKLQTGTIANKENELLGREKLRSKAPWPAVFDVWYPNPKLGQLNQPVKNPAHRFKFTELSESLAFREKVTDSIGLITLAFYGRKSSRDIGIGRHEVEEQRYLKLTDFEVGQQLAVVNVRYVEEGQLKDE